MLRLDLQTCLHIMVARSYLPTHTHTHKRGVFLTKEERPCPVYATVTILFIGYEFIIYGTPFATQIQE